MYSKMYLTLYPPPVPLDLVKNLETCYNDSLYSSIIVYSLFAMFIVLSCYSF